MDLPFLTQTQLFRGIREDEIEKMLDCMGSVQKHFDKGAGIYRSGDIVQSMGLVLSGSVNIESYDFDGKKSILAHSTDGQLFAETYACIPGEPLMVNVTAAESTDVLFLNVQRMMQMCPTMCPFHNKLIMNLFTISAQKNLNLSWRILHTSPKRIRERLYSYLLFQSRKQGSNNFIIPFDRQQLADYLNIDRSAMSHELGKMQKEGLLVSEKNHFTLLK